eukprot:7386503-Prymnesium_polylepis.3
MRAMRRGDPRASVQRLRNSESRGHNIPTDALVVASTEIRSGEGRAAHSVSDWRRSPRHSGPFAGSAS